MNKINPWYFTGFVEGEGALTYCRTGLSAYPRFSIRQNISYYDLLWRIREFLGFGRIYTCKARPPTKESAYLVVSNFDELPRLVDHFNKYPLESESKKKVFAVWAEMVKETVDFGRKRPSESKSRLCDLAEQLSSLNLRPRGIARITDNSL